MEFEVLELVDLILWGLRPLQRDLPGESCLRVKSLKVRTKRYSSLFFALGRVIPCAIIYEPGQFTLIGHELDIEFAYPLLYELEFKLSLERAREAYRYALSGRRDPPSPDNLLMIQHRVCELWPGFRILRPGGRKEGQAEVWLRPTYGNLHLGGCVWTRDYYISGQCEKDHGSA